MATSINAWSPVTIGRVDLKHRVVLAPLTRGRATESEAIPRTWVPNKLMEEYYVARATPGGLLISEASPVSKRASGFPGIPGWFTKEQSVAWKSIIDAVHDKGAIFFTQLWHQGRNTHSLAIGQQPESASSVAIDGSLYWNTMPVVPFEVPKAMSVEEILQTQDDFVTAGKAAIAAGCDGVELHAGNGYLFDQFLHSNINQRSDEYGGDIEKRCLFLLETVDKMATTIGSYRLGVRLTPYGLFNQTLGEKRLEQWTYLCQALGKRQLAYVHLVEPRFDEFKSAEEKAVALGYMQGGGQAGLAPFRRALGGTPLISAGGFGPDTFQEGIATGAHDLVAFGRFFVANPDLVERLREEQPLYKWDRSRFYGPFPDNEIGYTVFSQRDIAPASDRLKPQLAD